MKNRWVFGEVLRGNAGSCGKVAKRVIKNTPALRDEESFARFATDTFFDYEDYLYFKCEYNTCWRERAREGLLVAGRRLNRERIETCLSQMDQAVQRLKDLRARFSSYEEFTFDLTPGTCACITCVSPWKVSWIFAGTFWQSKGWR
jgi:hypothetical protein